MKPFFYEELHFYSNNNWLSIKHNFSLQPIEASDEAFWEQFWSESVTCVQDVFTLIPAAEIRALREESPSNLATLCYKAVEKLVSASESGCPSHREQQIGTCMSRSKYMESK